MHGKTQTNSNKVSLGPACRAAPPHAMPFLFSQFSAMKHPRLKNAFSTDETPKYFNISALRSRSSIDSNSSCSCCVNRVDLATHRTPTQLPSRIQGAMRPASALSIELATLLIVVWIGRTRRARRLKSQLFARKKKTKIMECTYLVRVISIRHRNEPVGGMYVPGA